MNDEDEQGASSAKKPIAKTKLQKDFQKVRGGGRVRVQSLDSLWTNFWAKIFGKEPAADVDEGYEDEDMGEEEQDQRSLWERKFSR